MKRRSITLAVAAVAVAAIVWPAAALSSPQHGKQIHVRAANSQTFTDPTGDGGNAPDVTTVTVSNDDNGQITFVTTLANRPSLTDSDFVALSLDTDGNASDGIGGADYLVGFVNGGAALFSAAGGSLAPASAPSFSSSFANGVETISINKSDIGNPTQINFVIGSSGDNVTTIPEFAPDSGVWNYQVTIAPPPPPPPRPRLRRLLRLRRLRS
jgi:hypothetical protein